MGTPQLEDSDDDAGQHRGTRTLQVRCIAVEFSLRKGEVRGAQVMTEIQTLCTSAAVAHQASQLPASLAVYRRWKDLTEAYGGLHRSL